MLLSPKTAFRSQSVNTPPVSQETADLMSIDFDTFEVSGAIPTTYTTMYGSDKRDPERLPRLCRNRASGEQTCSCIMTCDSKQHGI